MTILCEGGVAFPVDARINRVAPFPERLSRSAAKGEVIRLTLVRQHDPHIVSVSELLPEGRRALLARRVECHYLVRRFTDNDEALDDGPLRFSIGQKLLLGLIADI